MNRCMECPRKCLVDRSRVTGYCGVLDKIKIARASLHMWEEPCISTSCGSGTIFFSGCNLRCVYCQNYNISHNGFGMEIDVDRLVEIFFELKEKGASNINLVTPSHYVSLIREAIVKARSIGFDLPFIYNSSGYDSIDALEKLKGLIDVYLPDFKYIDDNVAYKYSNCKDYVSTVIEAIDYMYNDVGRVVFDEYGAIKKGVIVRVLVLPNYVDDSKKIIKYLYSKYKDNIYISIMNQYTPMGNLDKYSEINSKLTISEYNEVVDYAISIGVSNAYIQEEGTCDESFIPCFDLEGVEKRW